MEHGGGTLMVKVLRHDRPPERCEHPIDMTPEQLQAAYGHGTFLSQHSDYLCALPAHLRQALEQINTAADLPDISPDTQPASLSIQSWLSYVRKANPSLSQATRAVSGETWDVDEEWAECLRRAAQDRSSPPLLRVTPPVQQGVAVSVTDALSRGWESKFEDPLNVVHYLARTVDGYMALWETGRYFASWTMVLQSSGWGKSRSIQELATQGFHVAYVSFLSFTATGIPPRTPVADVLSDAQDPRCIAAWVVAILSEIGDADPLEWRNQQLEVSFKGKVSKSYYDLMKDVTGTVVNQTPLPGEPWHADQLRSWIENKLDSVLEGKKVVFCMDEAASLFKNEPGSFIAFRRFFSATPKELKLFGLLAGTAGNLGLVFPQKMSDPSARALDQCAMSFEPLWVVGSSLRDIGKLKHLMSQHEDVAVVSKEFTTELFKMGRPLWRALLGNHAEVNAAVDYALQKLLNGISVARLQPNAANRVRMTEAMATAIIGVAVGLEVAAWADLVQLMVAGHMRSVCHISGDRERFFTADVIEPILGEAAARILESEEVLVEVLRIIGGVFKQAYVVEGPREEIVGRLVLVLVMHHCCRLSESGSRTYQKYSHPVPLGVFLSQLCGRTVKAKGFIFFNRFMFLNRREISAELLLSCFVCGFAIIPQTNQAAYDVLLPCLIPGPDGTYKLQADRMRAVPVQIRNRQADTFKTKKCLSLWAPKEEEPVQVQEYKSKPKDISGNERPLSYALPKYFSSEGRPLKKQRTVPKGEEIEIGDECGLYLHVQGKEAVKDEVDITEDSMVLVLRGVRFPCLEERVSVELEKLCSAFYKLEDELEVEKTRGTILHHNFNNYFKLRKKGNSREPDLLLI